MLTQFSFRPTLVTHRSLTLIPRGTINGIKKRLHKLKIFIHSFLFSRGTQNVIQPVQRDQDTRLEKGGTVVNKNRLQNHHEGVEMSGPSHQLDGSNLIEW